MTSLAILGFFNFHRLMTTKALAVVRTKQSGRVQFGLIERLSVTTLAQRRRNTDRAVVMATLTHYVLVTVEVRRDLALANMLHEPVYHLAMRELDGLVLFREESDCH